jgi:hypothetical protein
VIKPTIQFSGNFDFSKNLNLVALWEYLMQFKMNNLTS